ncbi:hypothetical protein AB0N89_02630 [Amycolatopsis sp. NPDC089917]
MRGVVLVALAGTAVAYVVLTLEFWVLLIGFGACATGVLTGLALKK